MQVGQCITIECKSGIVTWVNGPYLRVEFPDGTDCVYNGELYGMVDGPMGALLEE